MTRAKMQKLLLDVCRENLPERSRLVGWGQLVEMTSITPAGMAEIMELGWIDPVRTGSEEYLFRYRDVFRIKRMLRIMHDLDMNCSAASIVVDLIERIETLEKELEELKQLV